MEITDWDHFYNITKYYDYKEYFYDDDFIDIALMPYMKIYNFMKMLSIICYSITILVGFTGNGLVIWIAGSKMKTVSAIWFLNLAIVDFISCIFLVLRVVEWALPLDSPSVFFLCHISLTALFTNMLTSVYFLTVISIDRGVSIMWPFWAKRHRTQKLARIISGIIWLLSLIITVISLVFSSYDNISECSLKYISTLRIRYRSIINVVFIVRNICIFTIPFLIILVSYGLIVFKLKTIRRWRQSSRPFMIIAAIVICFFICWFPYHTWSLIKLSDHYWKTNLIISEVSVCLAYFSSCINPILYVFLSKNFKSNFVNSMQKRIEIVLSEPCDLNCYNADNKTETTV